MTYNAPASRIAAQCPACGAGHLILVDERITCVVAGCPDPNLAHTAMQSWYVPPPPPDSVPVGTMVGHPTDRPLPEGWIRPRGQHLAADEYPELAAFHGARGGDLTSPIVMPDCSDFPTYALRVK